MILLLMLLEEIFIFEEQLGRLQDDCFSKISTVQGNSKQ